MGEVHYVASGRILKSVVHLRFQPGQLRVILRHDSEMTLLDPTLHVTRKGVIAASDARTNRSLRWKVLSERDAGYGQPAGRPIVDQSVLATPFMVFLVAFTIPSWLRTRAEIRRERSWYVDRLVRDARENHVQLEPG